ncbi:Gfo/Idh/MocA family oxidoreductase [Microbacterium lacus]|uniref:Gfo/Idh/MocA family protein n=1 Tax=Microbacterium lacus TaxID=415217 RepID=UPI00384AD368
MTPTSLRYGIVGAGYFGREFARILRGIPGAKVAGVYSPGNGAELAREADCLDASTLEDLLDEIDVVIVASPNHAHLEPVVAAAARGVHVFCEKPVALTYADCDAMLSACERAGTLFMAGHVLHFMPGVERAAQLVNEGAIGEPVVGRAVRTGWEDGSRAPSWKKTRALSGGHHFHHIHELDVLQLLMGAADTATMISGQAPQAGSRTGDEDPIALATLTLPHDRYATLEWGSVHRRPEHQITLQGTEGYLTIDMHEVGVTIHTGAQTERFPLHDSYAVDAERARQNASTTSGGGVTYGDASLRPPGWLRAGMHRELEYFDGLVRGTVSSGGFWRPLTDGTAARSSIATASALTLASELRRTVVISEVTAAR